MTCNQLIVLAEMYRGTRLFEKIGTWVDDLCQLRLAGYVREIKPGFWEITEKGEGRIKAFLALL